MGRRCELLGQEEIWGQAVENLKYDLKLKGIGQHVLHTHRTGLVVKKDKCDKKQGK